MEKQIYKYPLTPVDIQIIKMPKGAEILSLQVQNNVPCIWALVDKTQSEEERYFETFATGERIIFTSRTERTHVGTYQLSSGRYIFHVFENVGA